MHRILTEVLDPVIGNKAEMLCRLDNMGLTSDFVVVADDFFELLENAPYKTQKKILENKIKKYTKMLGGGPLIIRSSAEEEDSSEYSCAGLFLSLRCVKRTELLDCIRKVRNSRNSAAAMAYFAKKNSKIKSRRMGVIIQKYIKGQYGLVAFSGGEPGNGWWYSEFAEGGAEQVVSGKMSVHYFMVLREIIFFSLRAPALPFPVSWPVILKMLWHFKAADNIDLESVITRDNIYIVQYRPVTVAPDPFSLDYVIFRNCFFSEWKNSFSLFSSWCAKFLSVFKMPAINMQISGDEIYTRGESLKQLFDHFTNIEVDEILDLFKPAENISKKIYTDGLNIIAGRLYSETSIKNSMSFILLQYALFNLALSEMINRVSKHIISISGEEFFHKYIDPFFKLCESGRIVAAADYVHSFCLRTDIQREMIILFKIEFIILDTKKNMNTLKKLFLKKNMNSPIFLADEKYKSLYDWADSVPGLSLIYQIVFGSKITPETEENKNHIASVAENNCGSVSIAAKKSGKMFFIEGVKASSGDAEGIVFVIGNNVLSEIPKNSIVVAKNLSGRKYNSQIMKNAAGIIVENNGIISHPAIIARELHIPCLAGCANCTVVFRNGDKVKISGRCAYLIERPDKYE